MEIIAVLKAEVLQRKELADGYQYTFTGSVNMIHTIVSFIKTERECCDFFTFGLLFEPGATNVLLAITGPKGVKEFINSEINL